MWTPYDSQINEVRHDIGILDEAISKLGLVSTCMKDVHDQLSNLGSHISAGFMVDCSVVSVSSDADRALADSKDILKRARAELEAELDSLESQQGSWIDRKLAEEAAARQRAELEQRG